MHESIKPISMSSADGSKKHVSDMLTLFPPSKMSDDHRKDHLVLVPHVKAIDKQTTGAIL